MPGREAASPDADEPVSPSSSYTRNMTTVAALGDSVKDTLELINVPSYAIDANGVIRWTNAAARRLVGDVRGRQFTSLVAPEDVRRARDLFARKIVGGVQVTDAPVVLVPAGGDRLDCEVSSVPLVSGGHVVGVFGQLVMHQPAPPAADHPELTPRQSEILRLLEHGRSTAQIADELHLSIETVRSHVRRLLRALGVHSRLEAVAVAGRRASA
jgi:PAS domain S-box-containing protein